MDYNGGMEWLMVLVAFACGTLPFSFWIGRALLGVDVRRYGDGNPGSTNVFRAGSPAAGVLALLLDTAKAAAPVGFSYVNLGVRGLPMFLIAVAPVLGHRFSPFLRGRGGKAAAPVLGAWIGLTLWKGSLAALLGAVTGLALTGIPGWGMLTGIAFIAVLLAAWLPDPLFWAVLAAHGALLAWTHRADLRRRPRPLWLRGAARRAGQ